MFDSPAVTTELPRDRYGRPLIAPPDGGQPVAYTRVTTFAHSCENTYHLGKWAERMVALGMAKRKDLQLAGSAIIDPDDRSQKRTLQDLAEKAKDAAAPSAAAIGTALHTFTEIHDQGGDTSGIPEEYRADIEAYAAVTKVYDVHSVETFVVNDEFRVGGTYDRIYGLKDDMRMPESLSAALTDAYDSTILAENGLVAVDGVLHLMAGTAVIGDVKTGKSVDFGAASFAIQLGTYANSDAYDHTTGSRTPLPENLCRILGVVVHVPAGKGKASLHWLWVDEGWNMAQTCQRVREWQSRRDLIHRAVTVASPTPTVVEEITGAATVDALKAVYLKHRAAWTPGLNALAGERKAAIIGGAS